MALVVDRCAVPVSMRWDGTPGGWIVEYGKDHDSCPGKHTTDGVLGGWVCSCECHLAAFPKDGEA